MGFKHGCDYTDFYKKLSSRPSTTSFIIFHHIFVLKVFNDPDKNLNVLFVLTFLAPSFSSKCFKDVAHIEHIQHIQCLFCVTGMILFSF